ncbi:MAG: hypothetical protein HY979_01940, partial [Candidatus Magasanikbacteria bacterium]|nr:hypothetical protein [Candidatus Magasanikbacteria bacterium]
MVDSNDEKKELKIETSGDLDKNTNSDFSSKETELQIEDVSASGAKVGKKGKTLEINLDIEPPTDNLAETAAAAVLMTSDAKEEVVPNLPRSEGGESTNLPIAPNETTEPPEEQKPNEVKPSAEKLQAVQGVQSPTKPPVQPPIHPPEQTQPENNQPTAPEAAAPEAPQEVEKQPSNTPKVPLPPQPNQPQPAPSQESAPINPAPETNTNQPQPDKTPPKINKQPEPTATKNQETQPPASEQKTPPSISEQQISNVGPQLGQTSNPPTISADNQKQAGSELAENQAQNKIGKVGLGDRIKGGARQGIEKAKGASDQFAKNLTANFQSDRARKRQLGQQRRKLESELKKLENRVDGVKSSLAMQIIRFWLPTLYSTIMGVTFGVKNIKGQAKIKMLQAKIATLETIHRSLQTAEAGSAIVDSTIKVVRMAIVAGPETLFIATALILIISPILILFMASIMYILKKGNIIPAIEKIDKEIR